MVLAAKGQQRVLANTSEMLRSKYEAASRPSQKIKSKNQVKKSRYVPASENPIAACLAPMALRAH
jgi:hypothetical protein